MCIRDRDSAKYHAVVDTIRGDHNIIYSNDSGSESNPGSDILDITSPGFTVWDNQTATATSSNQSGDSLIAWCWKAGASFGSGTGSKNVEAGFSIVTWEGNQDTWGYPAVESQTIAHGLGSPPELIIAKNRDSAEDWIVYHKDLEDGINGFLTLNDNSKQNGGFGSGNTTDVWNGTAPTDDDFYVSEDTAMHYHSLNTNGENFVAYCFRSIPGYSRVGSFVGNSATNGVMVSLDFAPAYIWLKSRNVSSNWIVYDNKRSTYNVQGDQLKFDLTNFIFLSYTKPAELLICLLYTSDAADE